LTFALRIAAIEVDVFELLATRPKLSGVKRVALPSVIETIEMAGFASPLRSFQASLFEVSIP
jgi:hypothetical protein